MIPATERKAGPFTGDGVNTSFPFTFRVYTTADVLVTFADSLGVEAALVLDSDYSVALNPDQGSSPGGTVTYPISGSPLSASEGLVLTGALPLSQEVDLPGGGDFSPSVITAALDRAVMLIQQVDEKIGRAVLVDVTSTTLPEDLLAGITAAAASASADASAAAGSATAADASADAAALSEAASAVDLAAAQALLLSAKLGAGADIASAATLPLAARTGNLVRITGTTAVTATDLEDGGQVWAIADGALPLTYHATDLPLQGGASYTCSAGDLLFFERDGSSALSVLIFKKDGTAVGAEPSIFDVDATVAANAMTLTINPCVLDFRSTTLTDGTPVTRTISAAINTVISSGSTGGATSGVQSDIVIAAIDNAGTVEVAWTNLSGGQDLSETGLISTTAEGGAGAADSATTWYSTTARTNVAYRVVGMVRSTQATAGTWATTPSLVQGNGGAPQVKLAMSAAGAAPIYACRAWVNFNGTGTVAIRGSGNVSSITDNGTGNYTVNFITAMTTDSYTTSLSWSRLYAGNATNLANHFGAVGSQATGSVDVCGVNAQTSTFYDPAMMAVAIFD